MLICLIITNKTINKGVSLAIRDGAVMAYTSTPAHTISCSFFANLATQEFDKSNILQL